MTRSIIAILVFMFPVISFSQDDFKDKIFPLEISFSLLNREVRMNMAKTFEEAKIHVPELWAYAVSDQKDRRILDLIFAEHFQQEKPRVTGLSVELIYEEGGPRVISVKSCGELKDKLPDRLHFLDVENYRRAFILISSEFEEKLRWAAMGHEKLFLESFQTVCPSEREREQGVTIAYEFTIRHGSSLSKSPSLTQVTYFRVGMNDIEVTLRPKIEVRCQMMSLSPDQAFKTTLLKLKQGIDREIFNFEEREVFLNSQELRDLCVRFSEKWIAFLRLKWGQGERMSYEESFREAAQLSQWPQELIEAISRDSHFFEELAQGRGKLFVSNVARPLFQHLKEKVK